MILLKYTPGHVTSLLKIPPCLSLYKQCKPEPWQRSTGLYGLVSLVYFLPSPAHFTPVPLDTLLLKHKQHSHISGPLHYLSPLTGTLFPLTSHDSFPHLLQTLLNSHHLNRQPCPTYLKLYCTPSPHTPSSRLSYSVCPP